MHLVALTSKLTAFAQMESTSKTGGWISRAMDGKISENTPALGNAEGGGFVW